MNTIALYSKENNTSLFIQDVLLSLNYNVISKSEWSLETEIPTIVIWDLDSFDTINLEALQKIRKNSLDTMILVYGNFIQQYIHLPRECYDIILSVESLKLHLMTKINELKEIYNAKKILREKMSHLVGESSSMKELRKRVEKTILNNSPVLIQGETGVGKDLVAGAIACIYKKFVTVNCSAIPDALFESELFGHIKGAFTGAQSDRIGLFEEADGGAIFLDEIGDMPMHTQVKLLRAIQNHEIRPIGSNKSRHVNVRIIAATNRNLKSAILEKTFREDLYYRLNVISIQIEPLRNRKEDIKDLTNYFIKQYAPPGNFYTLSEDALEKLKKHSWGGNIRELENVIQRALCFSSPGILTSDDIQIDEECQIENLDSSNYSSYDQFKMALLNKERNFLLNTIKQQKNSVRHAAEFLKIPRTALYNRLHRLGVDVNKLL